MKTFLKRTGAFLTSLRIWTINLLTLIVLIYLVVGIVVILREMPAAVDPEGKVLIMSPEGLVLDQEAFPSEFSFPFTLPGGQQIHNRIVYRPQ